MKSLLIALLITLAFPLYVISKNDFEKSKKNYYPVVTKCYLESKLTDNTIILFNNELKFGMSSDNFKSRFMEFKLDFTDGINLNYKYETNYSNTFDNFWITAVFKDDKLSCLELNGWQSEEYLKLVKTTLKQLIFDKTVTEENEDLGTVKTDYYHKDNLKAEYFSFETTVLKICLDN